MDSQGFVFLDFLAGFKRIKALTGDMDLVRHVCSQLRSVEFRSGEDGRDRLRRREGWEQWVRPMEERAASARNDGPPSPLQYDQAQLESHDLPKFHGSAFSGTTQITSPTWINTAFQQPPAERLPALTMSVSDAVLDGNISETPSTAVVPEIPSGDQFSLVNGNINEEVRKGLEITPALANGHQVPNHDLLNGQGSTRPTRVEDENVFPDEQIDELTVVSRKNDMISVPAQPSFISASTRTFSHGSIDGQSLVNDSQIDTAAAAALPSLRGGAGNTDQ